MTFYFVDVFGNEKYSGNQLAIVILNESIAKEKMQQIANEFHYSETTFVSFHISKNNKFRVNIFTPQNEVPFAGHPTLGTAYILKKEIIGGDIPELTLQLNAGDISVHFDSNDLSWMKQIQPAFGNTHNAKDIASIINISEDEIDNRYPIQDVSTGLEFTIIPIKTLQSVKSASTNLEKYKRYFYNREAKPLFLFCPETYDKTNQINCRMFADIFGVPEDPATGSANGCLAAYLIKYNYFHEKKINITVEQGYEIGRKSTLHLKACLENDKYDIQVGGKVIMVAKGELY